MDYVLAFLRPFLKDKAVWVAAASWLVTLANAKLDLGMDADWVASVAGLISAAAVAKFTRTQLKNKAAKKAAGVSDGSDK